MINGKSSEHRVVEADDSAEIEAAQAAERKAFADAVERTLDAEIDAELAADLAKRREEIGYLLRPLPPK